VSKTTYGFRKEEDMFSRNQNVFPVRHATWLIAVVSSLLIFTVAQAASGDLDTTFGTGGRVTTDVGGSYQGVLGLAIQSDGKIVAVGNGNHAGATPSDDFAVVRYKTNGSLDTTFSGDGKLTTNFGAYEQAQDVAIQPDGKIIVTGTHCLHNMGMWDASCDLAVARYKPNGALDPTFSGNGRLKTSYGGWNGTWGGVAIQSDGKIVISGFMDNGSNMDFAVYRYNANGTLDTTFSGDGRQHIDFGKTDMGDDLVLQPDGKIVISGITCDGFSNCDFAVARLEANGVLDITFSGDGKQVIIYGGNDLSESIALAPGGKIVLSGSKATPSASYFALARLNPNGSLDTTFNGTSKVLTSFGPGTSTAGCDMLVRSNGKIVVNGSAGGNFAMARYNANGSLDTTFSSDGKVIINFGYDDSGMEIALQTNGRYVLGGFSNNQFALARVMP
jgi:uncharacterized delta-60 repeat protein